MSRQCVICSVGDETGPVAAVTTVALVQLIGITAVEADLCDHHRLLTVRTRQPSPPDGLVATMPVAKKDAPS